LPLPDPEHDGSIGEDSRKVRAPSSASSETSFRVATLATGSKGPRSWAPLTIWFDRILGRIEHARFLESRGQAWQPTMIPLPSNISGQNNGLGESTSKLSR